MLFFGIINILTSALAYNRVILPSGLKRQFKHLFNGDLSVMERIPSFISPESAFYPTPSYFTETCSQRLSDPQKGTQTLGTTVRLHQVQ